MSQSIRSRLFLIFLFSLLGLLLIVSFVYYQRATEQIRDKVGVIAEKNISQTVGLFDLLLQGYDSVTKSLNSNNELMRLLQQRATAQSVEAVNLDRRITDIMGAVFYSRHDIIGIHIVTSEGKVFSFDRANGAAVRNYSETQWFAQLKRSTGEMKWLGVFPASLMSGGIDRPVFAFGRQLFELSGLKPVGYVLIETDAEAIESALSNASLGTGGSVLIRGPEGGEITRTTPPANEAEVEPVPADWPGALASGQVAVRERKDALMTAAHIDMADWTVIGVTPKRDLKLELKETQQFLLTVIFVLVIAATLLATLVSRSFSAPFKRLIKQMKQVELGNFKGEVRVHSYQELNVLVNSFNRMVGRMDDLVERIKLASISEKNAQLQALQSQVNPHFLFNTLDMIYWMLDERGNDRLGRVILALSQFFRYSSDWEEAARAPLRLELAQLQHYLTIIGARLEGRLRTEIEVEERWLDIRVPKMILQPIIENAVKYGLEPLGRPGLLRVWSREADGKLEIVVEDDGIGMDGETLARLAATLEEPTAPSSAAFVPEDATGGSGSWRTPETGTAAAASASAARPEPAGNGVRRAGPERPVAAEAAKPPAGSAAAGRRGVGLLNVHRRIRLMFGEEYGLRIESGRCSGTKVIAMFPLPGGEEPAGLLASPDPGM